MSETRGNLAQIGMGRHTTADPATLGGPRYDYDAFISYRRRDAAALARWIRNRLHRYKLPPEILEGLTSENKALHERRPSVWLDSAYEKSSDDFLIKKIYPALDRSARLIVVSTPPVFDTIPGKGETQDPNWLVREIEHFLDGGTPDTGPRPVDIVLGPGGADNRFPGRLAEREHWDWIDCRLFNWWRSLGLSEELDVGLTKLVAGLYDVPDSQLPILRREERRRRTKWLVGISVLAMTVASVISVLGIFAWQQQRRATRNSEISEARRLTAEAELIIAQQPARLSIGVLLAADAVGRFRRLNLDSPEASEMVRRGLALLPRIIERQPFSAPAITVSRNRAVFSKGGQHFAVSNNDKIVQLFDLRDGLHMHKLKHDASVDFIRFSADARYIVTTTSRNGSANPTIWDLTGVEPTKAFEKELTIRLVAISSEGSYLMTSGDEGASIWETATGESIYSFDHKIEIIASEFSPDGKYLVTIQHPSSSNNQVAANKYYLDLYLVGAWTKVRSIRMNQYADTVIFSPDSRYISLASGANSTISTWEVSSGELVSRMHHGDDGIDNIYFSPTGTLLASGGYDMTTRIWRIKDASEVTRIRTHGLGHAVAFSPDEKYVATAFARDNVARVYNTYTGIEVARMSHGDEILSAAFLPVGMHLATASSDGNLHIWDMPRTSVAEHELDWELQAVSVSPGGRYVATLNSDHSDHEPIARVWDFDANKEIFSTTLDKSEHDQIIYGRTNPSGIAISSDGKYLAAVGYWSHGHIAQVWDTESRREVFRVVGSNAINSISLSSNGKYLATLSNGVGRLWDLNSRQPIHPTEFPAGNSRFRDVGKYVAISGDEKHVAMIDVKDSNKKDNTYLWVYMVEPGNKASYFKVADGIRHIDVSHDGKLAATTDGRSIQVWDTAAGAMVYTFKQNEIITSLAFDLTAEFLAASTKEGNAPIWNLRTGRLAYTVHHDGYLAAVAFSECTNGKCLLTANGYVTRTQGESAPNQTNSARLWHWEQADIIADACNSLSSLTEENVFQDIDSGVSFREICSNTSPSMK